MTHIDLVSIIAKFIQSAIFAPEAIADTPVTKTLLDAVEAEPLTAGDLLEIALEKHSMVELIEAALISTTQVEDTIDIVDGAIPPTELEALVLLKLQK